MKNVLTAENHLTTGGLADAVVDAGLPIKLRWIGISSCFCTSGSIPYLTQRYRMDTASIVSTARELIG